MIPAKTFTSLVASSPTPGSPTEYPTPSSSASCDESFLQPAQYCRWVIHVSNGDVDIDISKDFQPPTNFSQDSHSPTNFTQDVQPPNDFIQDSKSPKEFNQGYQSPNDFNQNYQSPNGFNQDYQPPNDYNQDSWSLWSLEDQKDQPLLQLMQESLAENNFTSISTNNLPISNSLISESLSKDSKSLQLESLKFAIMTGNLELIESILNGANWKQYENFIKIHPYHLAATYLDGGSTCCSLLATLMNYLNVQYPVARNNEDSMGHTIFDCLIISVLRSHTDTIPRDVSSGFADVKRYPGEEKDACGRWDADSPIIRQLFQRGNCRIPFSWKHPFCHSSVQAVCHNIMAIFLPGNYNPHIHQPSGLFIRHCGNCGTKLTLGTLHLIIVLAYHLATSGVQGETLFGAVAVLTCLLRLGADVSQGTEVSIHEILGDSSPHVCRHKYLDADEFMQTVPSGTIDLWKPECRMAWDCMRGILRLAKWGKIYPKYKPSVSNSDIRYYSHAHHQLISTSIDDEGDLGPIRTLNGEVDEWGTLFEAESSECPLGTYLHQSDFPCGNPQLGLVWAVAQAEMLTFRRKIDVSHWISENFSMAALKEWLEGESEELQMPLVQKEMLREATVCGWVFNKHFPFSTAQCITKQLFIHMDVHK